MKLGLSAPSNPPEVLPIVSSTVKFPGVKFPEAEYCTWTVSPASMLLVPLFRSYSNDKTAVVRPVRLTVRVIDAPSPGEEAKVVGTVVELDLAGSHAAAVIGLYPGRPRPVHGAIAVVKRSGIEGITIRLRSGYGRRRGDIAVQVERRCHAAR